MSRQADRDDLAPLSLSSMMETEDAPQQDQTDLPALERALLIAHDAVSRADSVRNIDPKHPKLSSDQQIVAYQFAVDECLLPFIATIQEAIDEIKLKKGEK